MARDSWQAYMCPDCAELYLYNGTCDDCHTRLIKIIVRLIFREKLPSDDRTY